MQTYLEDILTGLIVFPLVAAVFTVPYSIRQYRRFGAMPMLRVGIVYSLILYLICAYFMVILPLPSREEVAAAAVIKPQLIPFTFVNTFFTESGIDFSDASTYLPALKHASMYTVFFNLLLTLPLGIYLHYYFGARWWGALAAGFGMSLFYELTQLSGLYGLYDKAYRFFDVDDLIINTLGTMCGFWLSPLLEKILPTRERLDELSYQKGKRVTMTRRIAAVGFDWFLIACFSLFVTWTARLCGITALQHITSVSVLPLYALGMLIAFILIPILTRGATVGKWLVGVRLKDERGNAPKAWQILTRYGLLYGIILPMPFWTFFFYTLLRRQGTWGMLAIALIAACCVMTGILFTVHFFATAIKKENRFLYERLSGLHNVSIVKVPRSKKPKDHKKAA